MKTIRTAAMVMAALGASYSQVGTASEVGDVVQLGCTIPGPVDPSDGFSSSVYSLEAVNQTGSIIADFPGIVYGTSCTKAVNTILPRTVVVAGNVVTTTSNCGPVNLVTGKPVGVWQQAGTAPLDNLTAAKTAGVVPVPLVLGDGVYALQQFTFVCVVNAAPGTLGNGGLPANPTP